MRVDAGQAATMNFAYGGSTIATEGLEEHRCFACHALMFKARLEPQSVVEIVCPKKWCKQFNRIRIM